jgi:hypothetical protein
MLPSSEFDMPVVSASRQTVWSHGAQGLKIRSAGPLLPLAEASTDGLRCVQINPFYSEPGGPIIAVKLLTYRPLSSAVEHSLHTRGVSSSNLLAGTIF